MFIFKKYFTTNSSSFAAPNPCARYQRPDFAPCHRAASGPDKDFVTCVEEVQVIWFSLQKTSTRCKHRFHLLVSDLKCLSRVTRHSVSQSKLKASNLSVFKLLRCPRASHTGNSHPAHPWFFWIALHTFPLILRKHCRNDDSMQPLQAYQLPMNYPNCSDNFPDRFSLGLGKY